MTRPLALTVAAIVLLVLGGAALWLTRPRPEVAKTPVATTLPRPPATPAPPSASPQRATPAPQPIRRPTPARREPAAPAGPAPLRIEADVPDASVFLDRRFLGKVPVEVREVEPGNHRVNVSAEGYEMHAEDVVVGDQPVVVSARFREGRLDGTLAVVHKHGFGSCRGRLHSTPAGLAFVAEDGKDSFEAARGSVRLELDYLKKNLRVTVASRKSYNFTTEAPNADPLLLFEKATSAAWARLR